MRAAKRDDNHAEIRDNLRAIGAMVHDIGGLFSEEVVMPTYKVTVNMEREIWAEDEAAALNISTFEIPTPAEVDASEARPFFPVFHGFTAGDYLAAFPLAIESRYARLMSEYHEAVNQSRVLDSIKTMMESSWQPMEPKRIFRTPYNYAISFETETGQVAHIDMDYWIQAFEVGLDVAMIINESNMFALLDSGRLVGAVAGIRVAYPGEKEVVLWEAK